MKKTEKNTAKRVPAALRAAFPPTIPILAGFLFLGFSYGVCMRAAGFRFWYPVVTSVVVFGGSLEFLMITMLLGPFAPLQTFLMALMIQARHLFYGLAMLEKYKGTGWKKFYLIYGMCDESFSIHYAAEAPEGVDRNWFLFFVTLLNQLYWVAGVASGALLGTLLPLEAEGLDFVMTAMFTVIFLEQWRKEKKHYTALTGLGSAALCRLVFGADSFILPAMGCILLLLTLLRRPVEKAGGLP